MIDTGIVTAAQWTACSEEERSLIRSDDALTIWLNDYPRAKASCFMRPHADDFFRRLSKKSEAIRTTYVNVMRLTGCEFRDDRLLFTMATDVSMLPLLLTVLKCGGPIEPGIGRELMYRIAVLDTRGAEPAFKKKFAVMRQLSEQTAGVTEDLSNTPESGVGSKHLALREAVRYAVQYGAYSHDAPDFLCRPAPQYHEYGVLPPLVKAGARMPSDEYWIGARHVSGAGSLPLLASLATERVVDLGSCNSGFMPPARRQVHQSMAADIADAIEAACARGENVNAQVREGYRPIHFAALAYSPRGEVIRLLHAKGADVDALAPWSDRRRCVVPLTWAAMSACENDETGMLAALLDCGADPNLLDEDGLSVLDRILRFFPHPPIKIAELLLSRGARLTDLRNDGSGQRLREREAVRQWCHLARHERRVDLIEKLELRDVSLTGVLPARR